MSNSPLKATAEQRTDLLPGNSEHHRIIAIDGDGRSAIAAQVEIARPSDGGRLSASFACAYLRVDALPIVLAEGDIPAPDRLWELRASGLWADTVCEDPFIHWSYGLEAFGLAIDDPDELLGRGYGERVPLGWELDFIGRSEYVVPFEPEPADDPHPGGYSQVGAMEGIVLLAQETRSFRGPALRHHWLSSRAGVGWSEVDGRVTAEPVTGAASETGAAPGAGTGAAAVSLPTLGALWRLSHGDGGFVSRTEPR
jgi:hypothetical protein